MVYSIYYRPGIHAPHHSVPGPIGSGAWIPATDNTNYFGRMTLSENQCLIMNFEKRPNSISAILVSFTLRAVSLIRWSISFLALRPSSSCLDAASRATALLCSTFSIVFSSYEGILLLCSATKMFTLASPTVEIELLALLSSTLALWIA